MKRLKRIIGAALLLVIVLSTSQVFAANSKLVNLMNEPEFTEDFNEWLKLSEEDKTKVKMPRSREISSPVYTTRNPIKLAQNVGSVTLAKFNLKDYIPENLVVRNQMNTTTCWAFASLGMLESTLALDNYNNNNDVVVYDFSERHMQYSITRVFKDGEINKRGFNKTLEEGANYQFSMPYLLSGLGPIKELDMPFEDNTDVIELSQIQNKETVAYIKDTFTFPTYTGTNKAEIMQLMKEHIKKYGGIEAGIHGASLLGESYNIETGAMYVNDSTKYPYDHDVVIVGWDDSYSKENFNKAMRPENDGAWIIKNSWGTKLEHTLEEMKEIVWNTIVQTNTQTDWKSAEEIPDDTAKEIFKKNGYTIEGDKAVLNVGKDGFMYLSYDDANVYNTLVGIEKATDEMYDYIYLYDYLGAMGILQLATQKVIVANVFDKQSDATEFLTEVALEVLETTTCKVYVNPKNDSRAKSDFVEVQLKAGKTETIDAGHHTLEFLNPIELTGEKFVIAVELSGTKTTGYNVSTERPIENSAWSVVELEKDKCFWTTPEYFEQNEWVSFSDLEKISDGKISNSDTTLKAITVLEENKNTNILEKIEITTPPTKTEYVEGEDFDKTGMVVSAIYTNGTKEEVTDYTIKNGTSLKAEQETVIVEYQEKVATQTIKVTSKTTTPDDSDGEQKTDDQDKDNNKSKPEVSDFSKVEANVNSVKAYYFTDTSKKEYITIDVDLNKIERKENNDSYKYYYYLSSSPSQQNIKKWVEITEEQKSNTKLEFVMNTKDIPNYTEVSKAEKLYLYIKEVVTKDNLSDEITTNAILLETEGKVEIYKDNVKQTANNNKNDNNKNTITNTTQNTSKNQNTNKAQNTTDNTTANKKLPAAGLKLGVALIIVIIAVFGITKYIQYKKMDF